MIDRILRPFRYFYKIYVNDIFFFYIIERIYLASPINIYSFRINKYISIIEEVLFGLSHNITPRIEDRYL